MPLHCNEQGARLEGLQSGANTQKALLFGSGVYVNVAWNPGGGSLRKGTRRAVQFRLSRPQSGWP